MMLCFSNKLSMNLPTMFADIVAFVCCFVCEAKLCYRIFSSTFATNARFIRLPRHHLHHPFQSLQDDPRLEEIDNIAALH